MTSVTARALRAVGALPFLLVAACFVLLTLPTGLLFTYLSRRLVVQR